MFKMKENIVPIAMGELGTSENPAGSNMQRYGEWYGNNGVAWCAIFVSWVYHKAGIAWPKKLETDKGFAWCPTLQIRAKQNEWVTIAPEAGDIVLFDWEGDTKPDHAGIFKRWLKIGITFETIEGNTPHGVKLMERKLSQVLMFVKVC